MPTVEDVLAKNKAKKKNASQRQSASKKRLGSDKSNTRGSLKSGDKKLADFDPFGIQFVNEYTGGNVKFDGNSAVRDDNDKTDTKRAVKVSGNDLVLAEPACDRSQEGNVSENEVKLGAAKKGSNRADISSAKAAPGSEPAKASGAPKDASKLARQSANDAREAREVRVISIAPSNSIPSVKGIKLSTKQGIIYNLLKKHRNADTFVTPIVKASDLSKILLMSETSLRKQIQRMEEKGALKRHNHISGPEGGTSYVVYDVEIEENSFLIDLPD